MAAVLPRMRERIPSDNRSLTSRPSSYSAVCAAGSRLGAPCWLHDEVMEIRGSACTTRRVRLTHRDVRPFVSFNDYIMYSSGFALDQLREEATRLKGKEPQAAATS